MVTTEQAVKAIKTIKEFCSQKPIEECHDYKCPIHDWCYERERTPEVWKVEE